ncbi:nuclear transport factor 2 family protein [Streptomyces sp. NPDC020707]|uniref:Nuclear transport factor 2 family protein n=1 Tax=Streptomyces ortus TaxID=2867268 RepID=A0ABT3VH13_9ACTN|nr:MULTISPECIES: nuclear transport factor 2 family protein [Streptomyces]MCX4238851.1 nuclear transport factor 2 family protein [Streptomyces ortus]
MSDNTAGSRSYHESMQGWAAAINAQDVEKMVSFFSEDVSFEDVAMQRKCRGRDQLRALLRDWMATYETTTARLLSVSASKTTGFTEWELTVTRAASPCPAGVNRHGIVLVRGACVDEFGPDGLIHHHRDYWNTAELDAP